MKKLLAVCVLAGLAFTQVRPLESLGAAPSTRAASTRPTSRPSVPAATQPARGEKPALVSRLDFNAFLRTVEKDVLPYRKGRNSVEKEDILTQARQRAAKLLEDSILVLEFEARDVKILSPGVADISVGGMRNVPVLSGKNALLSVVLYPTLRVRMTKDQAKTVEKGDRLVVTCHPIFHPRKWGAVGPSTGSQQMATISVKDAGVVLGGIGTITARDYSCLWRGQTLPTAFEKK